jgi:L-rhamnose mutarotase
MRSQGGTFASQEYTGGGGRTQSGRKRVCFHMQFDPTNLQQYIEDHKAIWPEMQEALVGCGWHNYSLFYRPDGFAVGYYETDNETHEESCRLMGETAINPRWQDAMKKYTAENVRPDEAMVVLDQYFYLGTDRAVVQTS